MKLYVVEIWKLRTDFADKATQVMQAMDEMLGPAAHAHAGWCGHASFYQNSQSPEEVMVLYPWKSKALHRDLTQTEDAQLEDFYSKYCTGPREIRYYHGLEVEVDHD